MESIKITYIGHATALIEAGGISVLTDPNFSDKILFVKRNGELKYDPARLPELTTTILSHTHFDHMDPPSFNYIRTTVPIVVPEGSERRVRRHLPNPIIELSHWAQHSFGNSLTIHSVPAEHSGYRLCPYPFKKSAGYIIQIGTKTIYFAGDSAYNSHFHDIGSTYSIDVALLPIGSYKPAFYLKRYHMDPLEAVQAFFDLNAKVMIPIHWGTFRLSLERLDEPIAWLKKIAAERNAEDSIKILEPGQSIEI